jgi:hypothetical protein
MPSRFEPFSVCFAVELELIANLQRHCLHLTDMQGIARNHLDLVRHGGYFSRNIQRRSKPDEIGRGSDVLGGRAADICG